MGDVARGIKSFRKGLADDDKPIDQDKTRTDNKDSVKN
jgi:Sec-independent protein translocase protein TatA